MKEIRTERVSLTMKPSELELLREVLKDSGLTISTYIRTCVLKDIAAAFPESKKAQAVVQAQVAEITAQITGIMIKAGKGDGKR